MNFLNMFESRIGRIFGESSRGFSAPFSFKKLAKRATREMDDETYVIDGIDTAPALYTILVSPTDDAAMRPLYASLTLELAQFIEAQAKARGYVFVGKPLVRFMVDPGLKGGKFSVFAENIDARTLARLRREEEAFLESGLGMGGAAGQSGEQQALRINQAEPRVPPAQVEVPAIDEFATYQPASTAAGPDMMPAASPDNIYDDSDDPQPSQAMYFYTDFEEDAMFTEAEAAVAAPADDSGPVLAAPAEIEDRLDAPVVAPQAPAVAPAPVAAPSPMAAAIPNIGNTFVDEADEDAYDSEQEFDRLTEDTPLPVPTRPVQPATSLLIDRQSGRTYTVSAPSCIIGRGRTRGGVLLRDPNVSRRHAEITYQDGVWRICDLNSTNGTLVNDVDIDECILRDGDLITLGLVNLEFRES